MRAARIPLRFMFAAALACAAAAAFLHPRTWTIVQTLFVPYADEERVVEQLIESEELLLALTPQLTRLARGVANLRFPDVESLDLWADDVEVRDLLPAEPADASWPSWGATATHWHLTPGTARVPRDELALWRALLDDVDYFDWARLYFIDGQFSDESRTRWVSSVGFAGLARGRTDEWWGMKATSRVVWQRRAPRKTEGEPGWEIVSWRTESFSRNETPEPFFQDVLDQALPKELTRQRARHSEHERMIVRLATEPDYRPEILPLFDRYSTDRHPGIAVVDLDRDGWDDVYFMNQWGKNLLLRNRGDGTFEDVAAQYGLDLENHCTSAVFADFDNDDDLDAVVGRTLLRSVYLENEAGRFVDRSVEQGLELPYLVSSVSAADYNNDGLLDVYFSTYAADLVIRSINQMAERPPAPENERLLADFLSDAEAREIYRRKESEGHQMVSRVGPPNVLVVNRGGRFERSDQSGVLAVWRNTFQSTWCDYDLDGDADLYVVNDFSMNNLFSNQGNGTFVDATETTQTADIGFGMGASWGDYDNDGWHDLYVTNMFSKAGQRITRSLATLVDPRFRRMASGNSLFRNPGAARSQVFTRVSGLERPALLVERAGWSWGGQLVDFNNDCYLDVFATNGYYTAPREIALDVDL